MAPFFLAYGLVKGAYIGTDNSYGAGRARLACRLAVCYAVGVEIGNCHEGCRNSRFGFGRPYVGTVC